jgi:signal transduction histidine kinase
MKSTEMEALEAAAMRSQERAAELERLLRRKDEFIRQLGHDLKTPLTPLVALLPNLINREQDPKLKEMANVLLVNVNFMKELVSKTLRLAKLDAYAAKTTLKDMSLDKALIVVADSTAVMAQRQGVRLATQMEEDIIVRADPLSVQEVLDNLVGNALKFTPEGGTIRIEAKKAGTSTVISVHDTGIGMTEEQLPHVFEEFYRADTSRHELQSQGLGLSICQRIVQSLGGEIWAESPGLGKGSTFSFTLKLSTGDTQETASCHQEA